MQVDAEVFGLQLVRVEQLGDEGLVLVAEDDGVVGDVRVLLRCAEVEDEEAHAVLHGREATRGEAFAVLRVDQLFVDVRRVGICDDLIARPIELNRFSRLQND